MKNLQGLGAVAAVLIALLNIANFVTVLSFGAEASTNQALMASLIISHKTNFYLLEFYKFLSASALLLLIFVLYQRFKNTKLAQIATIFGSLSALLLVASGVMGMIALNGGLAGDGQTYETITNQVNLIGRFVLFLGGFWYILINQSAMNDFPKRIARLGIALGIANILAAPLFPLGLLVLVLSIIWHLYLGKLLLGQAITAS